MSALFMLDTDSVSYALRGQGRVGERIAAHRPSELCVSAITAAELRFGATRRKSAKLHALLDAFLRSVVVVPFDESCAVEFGRVASELADRGSVIGDFDAMIGAHAVVAEATLVTNNVKHFTRIRGLRVENWL
ncbi:MAG TPA: type II toxin-antitoxin system VapC family toxin [Thermoanaerobaculia bacterium]|jgi:tRNA(fMet)-specific endonuclease VapC